MSLVDHVSDIAFATFFEIDKIFPEKYSGSFTVGASGNSPFAGNVVTSSVAQPHSANVLPVMEWSINGTDWYQGGMSEYSAGTSLDEVFTATCYTTSTSIVIIGQNFTAGDQTLQYKVCLISDD